MPTQITLPHLRLLIEPDETHGLEASVPTHDRQNHQHTSNEARPLRRGAAAQQLGQGRVPIEAWVQLWWLDGPPQNGQRTLAVLTTGLRPFIGREIEVSPAPLPPLVIAQRLFGALTYLLTHGPVLSDGDTIGISETERIRARFRDRGQRPGVPVIELSFERLDASGAPAATPPQPTARPSAAPRPTPAPKPFGKRGR